MLPAIPLLFGKACKNYTGEIKAAHQIPLQFARSAAGSGGRVSGIFSEQIEVVDHFVLFPQQDSTTVRHMDVHYNYITTLCCIWHGVAFQCNTVHYIAVRCIPLRCAALHCNYRALRYVTLQCVMCVRRLHSLTFHWIALRCNAWQYSVHGLILICTICMHACLQTYFSTNVEINWKTDKQPASQPGKQIDRHGDRRTCRDRYRDYDAETSHQWKKTDKLEFVW